MSIHRTSRLALLVVGFVVAGTSPRGQSVGSTPSAAPTLSGVERRITDNLADQFDPAISGNIIVYTDTRGFDPDIWYYDLTTGIEAPATTGLGNQQLTDVSNGIIVYTDFNGYDILAFSTVDGTTTNLTSAAGSNSMDPAIGQGLVAWQDERDGNQEIYARNLATGEERRITDSPDRDQMSAVNNGTIVWQRCATECNIFAYDWASGTTTQITDTPTRDERFPDISGNGVVYQALTGGEIDVCHFNLSTQAEKCLSLPGAQKNPNVSGDYVAFDDTYAGIYHVRLWHVPSGAVFDISGGTASQYLNDIDGNRIVYTDDRNSQLDIYMYEFTATFPNIPPVADAGPDQALRTLNTTVQLDGFSSYDNDGDYPLTYAWTLTQTPAGSGASLSDATAPKPTFVVDLYGDYTATLVVTDARGGVSDPDTVKISSNNVKPVANAGGNQSVAAGMLVTLNGTGSSDADGDPLTYAWSLVSIPTGSHAALANPILATTTFVADVPGTYLARLVVNDGYVDSDPSTATIVAMATTTELVATIQQTIASINGAAGSTFRNTQLRNALTNKLAAVLQQIDRGEYVDARAKLQDDILPKTNGCAAWGAPDKNDWIVDCTAQSAISALIAHALALLDLLA